MTVCVCEGRELQGRGWIFAPAGGMSSMSGVMGSMRYFAGGMVATAGLLAAAPLPKAECSNRDKVGPLGPRE